MSRFTVENFLPFHVHEALPLLSMPEPGLANIVALACPPPK